MSEGPIDPEDLEGAALTRWYRRSPDEIEQQRQIAAKLRYADFFGGSEDGATRESDASGLSAADENNADPSPPSFNPRLIDRTGAGLGDGHQFIDIGNPANRRLRQEYEKTYGQWPKTETGRNYDVAHRRAIADGGSNTLDNIYPQHPDEHLAEHLRNGDFARWARRSAIARAFGGRVAPPTPNLRVNGLGLLGSLSNVLGVWSGRVRTDSPHHFWYDMAGMEDPADWVTRPGETI